MTKVLFVKSSIRGEQSASFQMAAALRRKLGNNPKFEITERDVVAQPISMLDQTLLGGLFTAEADRSPEQRARVKVSDALITELKQSDVLVISAGMYNFGIPAQLKTYFDHVLRAGETFQYVNGAPRGMLSGKRAVILVGTGGVYSSGAAAAADFTVPYLKQLLAFIGITNVTVVRAEGQAMGDQVAKEGMVKAFAEVAAIEL